MALGALTVASDVYAKEFNWSSSINANAKAVALNTQVLPIRYPVLGDTKVPSGVAWYGGPASGSDDFCFTRSYANAQCTSGTGHAGNDIQPVTGVPIGKYPVVAAVAGTIDSMSCVDGSGRQIVVRGWDNRYYHYLHLHSFGLGLSAGQWVNPGQSLGTMGTTTTAQCTGSTGHHLHFEIRQGGNVRAVHAIDPYLSLRNAYAYLGRGSDGLALDNRFTAAWSNGTQYWSDFFDKMYYVGWPNVTSAGDANVKLTSSYWNSAGVKQFLTSSYPVWGSDHRSGVIIGRIGAPQAYLVPREIYQVFVQHGSEAGFLGFPASHYSSSTLRQNFEGGCVALTSSGWAANWYGSPPCQ